MAPLEYYIENVFNVYVNLYVIWLYLVTGTNETSAQERISLRTFLGIGILLMF